MAPPDSKPNYIILGGGTAGVTLASRLSTLNPSLHILLLERGPNLTTHPAILDPFGMLPTILGAPDPTSIVQSYLTPPQPGLNNRRVRIWSAETLSGSSAINVGVWTRPNRYDLAEIAKHAGNDRFRFESLLPYFKRSESWWEKGIEESFHGYAGPISVLGGVKFPLTDIMSETMGNMGIGTNGEGYDGEHEGRCLMPQNFRPKVEGGSERQHASNAYGLEGVDVRCGVTVRRVVFERREGEQPRAIGVELEDGTVIEAKREVIVCAGAFRTPQVLILSGIGPKRELEKLEIETVVESPGVGRNAFDHLLCYFYFKLKDPKKGQALPFVGHTDPKYFQRGPGDYITYLPASDGLKAEAQEVKSPEEGEILDSTLFVPGRTPVACIQYYCPLVSHPEAYPSGLANPAAGEYITLGPMLSLPSSRGHLTVDSTSPTENPVFDPKYLLHPLDIKLYCEAARRVLKLAQTSPFADEIEQGEIAPTGQPVLTPESSDEEIGARLRAFSDSLQHPAGTAAIGSVVDGDLKVKGVQGLRIVDLSVIPVQLGTMPQSFVYAMAEMMADELSKAS